MKASVVFVALLCSAPDRPDPTPPMSARPMLPFRERLNGKWVIVQSLIGGNPHKTITPNQTVFAFVGDKMTIRWDDGRKESTYSITVEEKANRHTIDLGNAKSKIFSAGIIKIEGDVLTMCVQTGGEVNRPTEFASPMNSRAILWQMKRVKK